MGNPKWSRANPGLVADLFPYPGYCIQYEGEGMSVPFWGQASQEEAKRMERQLAKTFRLGGVMEDDGR